VLKKKNYFGVIIAIFFLVLGMSFFVSRPVLADPTFCDDSDLVTPGFQNDGGCDGDCDASDVASPDCNGVCEPRDTALSLDCEGFCNEGDQKRSPDCDGSCATGSDDQCSVDCDPLGQCKIDTDLTSRDVRSIVGSIINVVLGILGTIAVVIIIIGGFKWMTSQGSEDKVGEAKKLMAAGVIGLAIVLAAYSISTFVVSSLTEATAD
jgi:type IV secretory pathway VirB2 component (pilin)